MTLSLKAIDRNDCEYDTPEGEIARRNVLFGLWAGQRMGLEGDAIEAYAWSVHLADSDRPGHDDVIAKVATDLSSHGRPLSDRQLRSYFQEVAMRVSLGLEQSYPVAIMDRRG
jgi:hypothetical protein